MTREEALAAVNQRVKNPNLVKHMLAMGAGDQGGYVIATGTPEKITEVPGSYTGQYLKPVLARHQKGKVAAGRQGMSL